MLLTGILETGVPGVLLIGILSPGSRVRLLTETRQDQSAWDASHRDLRDRST